MKRFKRSIVLLLTAAMLAAPLTACTSGQDNPASTTAPSGATTTVVTTDSPDKDEAPKPADFTPDDIRKKMDSSSYRITSKIDALSDGIRTKISYVLERQSSRYRMLLEMDMGDLGSMEQEMYFNVSSGRVYANADGQWYYYVDETVASEEMILSETFMLIAPDVLFDDDSYEYDAQNARYSMKRSVLAEQTGYDSSDVKKVSLYLSKAGGDYLVAITDGTDGTEASIRISFTNVTVKLPTASELPDEGGDGGDIGGEEGYVETPYIMNELLDLLEDRELLYVDSSSVEVSGMTVWGGEEPENLFDGKTTKCGGDRYNENNLVIEFALHEPATVSAYVLITANDTASYPARNPVEWTLLGSNDPWSNDWTVLDYVWDGNMYSDNFLEHGYLVDNAQQDEYLYYRLEFGYAMGTQFQLSEIRLYAGGVNPVKPENPDQGGNIGGEEVKEDPYILQYLSELLQGKEKVSVDSSSVYVQGLSEWDGEGAEHLFDGVLSKGGGNRTAAETIIYFALHEPACLSAYVFVTGNDTARFPLRNPVEWQLLGTNDPSAFTNNGINLEHWTVLDYVWDGGMVADNYFDNGYAIDPENQGEYQYYALMLGYSAEQQFQLSEIRLYADGDQTGGGTESDSDYEVYTGNELNGLVSGRNSLTDLGKIDFLNQYSVGFTPWNYDEDMHRLFDGIDTFDEWYYNPDGSLKEGAMPDLMEGGGPGKCSGMVSDGRAYFFFSTYEKETVEAYVLTTANDSAKFNRNPYSFALYATNDMWLFESYGLDYGSWVLLDSPVSGCMENQNFVSYGFTVDDPGAYRYYCLAIEYVPGTQFQLGELSLYIAG